jgi:hypothetical protein
MYQPCLLDGCDDVLLSRTIRSLAGLGYLLCAGICTSDDAREVDGVQRPESLFTQHELVW